MHIRLASLIIFAFAVSTAMPLASAESEPRRLLSEQDGKYVDALLALPCKGDIANKNGKLVCKAGPNPFAPPPGSYKKKCKELSMAGPILSAACKTAAGFSVNTIINTLDCRGQDIGVKSDGHLTCK